MSDDPHADAVFNLHRERQGFSDAEIIAKTTSANLHSIIRERDATIAGLRAALDGLVDCIGETRGKDAREALQVARAALAASEERKGAK